MNSVVSLIKSKANVYEDLDIMLKIHILQNIFKKALILLLEIAPLQITRKTNELYLFQDAPLGLI